MRLSASRSSALAISILLQALVAPAAWCSPASAAPTVHAVALEDTLRLDARVRAGVLPNGLHYFIRANHKPEARVALRLAVNVGSTVEDDDQRGLAHFASTWSSTARRSSSPATRQLPRVDRHALRCRRQRVHEVRRDGLHARRADRSRRAARRASTALRDLAGGVDVRSDGDRQGARRRARGVAAGAAAPASASAQAAPGRVPRLALRGAAADRPARDHREGAAATRLARFYHDWYTPDRMAVIAVGDFDPAKMEALIREHFGDLKRPARPRPTPVFDIPRHDETLVAIATDPEATGSSVMLGFKSPHEVTATVGEYRRDLVRNLYFSMLNGRFDEIAHRAAHRFSTQARAAACWAAPTTSWSSSNSEGRRNRKRPGVAARGDRARARAWISAQGARARQGPHAGELGAIYAERDKSESAGFAREYVSYFLTAEPAPGIEAE